MEENGSREAVSTQIRQQRARQIDASSPFRENQKGKHK
jgi:hypothetical protein